MKESFLTDIEGVYATGIHCGIKAAKKDLGLLYIPNAVASAGVFTSNKVKGSSVVYTKKALKKNCLKAVIVNSGNSNVMTGESGAKMTKWMAKSVADLLQLKSSEVGVSSTGIIGKPLAKEPLMKGFTDLADKLQEKDGEAFAQAILTTDLKIKTASYEKKIGKKTIRVAGVAKGSGMMAPNMATMLAYIVSNVSVSQVTLQTALTEAVNCTFNMASVDTDTSTSDMVLAFATGQHGIKEIDKQELDAFKSLLTECCKDLTLQIIRDGEGAKTLIEVEVTGAASHRDARKIVKSIVDSPLVKTAIAGADPNWGRVLMAVGKTADVKVNQKKISLFFGDTMILSNGEIAAFDRSKVVSYLSSDTVKITVDLQISGGSAVGWGCDLTKGYIDINTEYN